MWMKFNVSVFLLCIMVLVSYQRNCPLITVFTCFLLEVLVFVFVLKTVIHVELIF